MTGFYCITDYILVECLTQLGVRLLDVRKNNLKIKNPTVEYVSMIIAVPKP